MSSEIRIRIPRDYGWQWSREFVENDDGGSADRVIIITVKPFLDEETEKLR